MMETYNDPEIIKDPDFTLHLLEQIESDPDITQVTLKERLDVAVGTVNWHLKRLVSKGYVKVKRAQRRKLRYIITPEGIALRTHLTVNYIETSMDLYRRTRLRVRELLAQVKQNGFDCVSVEGEGDIADICRLTCLEQGVRVVEKAGSTPSATEAFVRETPVIEVRGMKVILKMEPKP
jgi:DNA-binding MarR family transcriptional regulator